MGTIKEEQKEEDDSVYLLNALGQGWDVVNLGIFREQRKVQAVKEKPV